MQSEATNTGGNETIEAANPEPQASEEYTVRELSANRDWLNINGDIYLPADGTGKYPTVIIGHDYGADHNNVSQYAEMFAQAGYATNIFDFCGGSSISMSDGTLLEMSVMTEVTDMEAVLDQIKTQGFTDQNNLFLLEASQGGLVAAVTTSERQVDLQGLIVQRFLAESSSSPTFICTAAPPRCAVTCPN